MRTCKSCGKEKPLEDFPTYKAKLMTGRRHTCRECWNLKWTPIVVSHNKRYYHENVNGYRERQQLRTRKQHKENPELHAMRNRKYREDHPEKAAAKVAVMMAVRSGKLKREPCAMCGASHAQAHHDDYSKPLDVMWLCPTHHGERHRLLNRFGEPSEWPEDLRVRQMPA